MSKKLLSNYDSDSRVTLHPVNYNQLERVLNFLEDNDGVKVSTIGNSDGVVFERLDSITLYGGERKDIGKRSIYALDIEPRKDKIGQFFIVAGHHPVEPAGPAAAIQFVAELLKSTSAEARTLRDHYHITVIPMVDVDYFSLPVRKRIYTTTNNFYHKFTR